MRKLNRFCMALLMAVAAQAGVANELENAAREAASKYVGDLLATIQEIKPLYESEQDQYFASVGNALDSFVDFREVARGVMAKYSTGPAGATEEQLDRFTEVFKASMVDFYGSALVEYNGQQIRFLESQRPARDPAKATNVRMQLISDDGTPFEVQYIMFLNETGVWKLKNLYIEGVNLRRQYHSRFDNLMSRNNQDIDKVIDSWQLID